MSDPARTGPIRRHRLAAWLVTGPVGRVVGFLLDLGREIGRLVGRRVAARTSRHGRGR